MLNVKKCWTFFSAALTDSFFSSGMCLGRMFSVLLSTIFLPSTLLCSSTLFCGVASLLLLLLAPHFKEGLYSGVLVMGFFVSWQFGTGFSWTSQYMNITGKLSSLFFVGKYRYIFVSPFDILPNLNFPNLFLWQLC